MPWAFSSWPTSRYCIFIHRIEIDLLHSLQSIYLGTVFPHSDDIPSISWEISQGIECIRPVLFSGSLERADLIRFIVAAYVLQPFYFEKSGEDVKSSVKP